MAVGGRSETRRFEYQSDFARKYYFEGKAEGKAEGKVEGEARLLLKLLRLRGFVVPEELERRISGCGDSERLELWAGRLLSAPSLGEVFGAELP